MGKIYKLDIYQWCDFNFLEVVCGSIATTVIIVGGSTLGAVATQSGLPFLLTTLLVIPFGLTALCGFGKARWMEYQRQRAIQKERDQNARKVKYAS